MCWDIFKCNHQTESQPCKATSTSGRQRRKKNVDATGKAPMETISLLLFLTQLIQWSHSLMLLILIPVFISGGQKGKKILKLLDKHPGKIKS